MPDHELAIFFNLKESSPRTYIADMWEVFMSNCRPEALKSSSLFHGEVAGLSPSSGRMFCIAVRNKNPGTIQYLKDVFAASGDRQLALPVDRIREADIIDRYKLKYRGRVDSDGCFETSDWSRADHDLCKATGWPYVPKNYVEYLRHDLMDELDKMARPGLRAPEASASGAKICIKTQ